MWKFTDLVFLVQGMGRISQKRQIKIITINWLFRSERNLANVFPFVGGNRGLPRARLFGEEPEPFEIDHATHHDHHDDHGDHHDHHDHSDHHEHSDHPDHHEHADHHDHNGLSLEQRIFNDFDTRISR